MKWLLLLILLAMPAQPQSAVFNNFSASTKGITIGTSHCYFWWLAAGGFYDAEVACYTDNVLKILAVKVTGSDLIGSFPCPIGVITWMIRPDKRYQFGALPVSNGAEIFREGSFQ